MHAQPPHNLNLLFGRQAIDGSLNNSTNAGLMHGNEARIVHEGNGAHDELAVHAVGHAAVAGNRVAKILDLKGALQAGGEEAAKGRDQRSKSGENKNVELHGLDGDAGGQVDALGQGDGKRVLLR